MKRLVLFGVAIFLVIIGGFLVMDKVWLHKIFEVKPGSCLILEEKYCKTGKVEYFDNKPIAIVYKVGKNVPIFSPLADGYFLSKATFKSEVEHKSITIGNKTFDAEQKNKSNNFQIIFDGNYKDRLITRFRSPCRSLGLQVL